MGLNFKLPDLLKNQVTARILAITTARKLAVAFNRNLYISHYDD